MIPTFWLERSAGISFPGRARVVGALEGATDHGEAGPVEALWLAAGAALAESRRGGLVATAVAEPDEGWWQAAAAVPRLGPLPLLLVAGPEVDRVRLAACGWPATQVVAGEWPVQVTAGRRQEWMPVQMPAIPMGNLPPWLRPASAAPRDQVAAALAWLGEREPALWVGGCGGTGVPPVEPLVADGALRTTGGTPVPLPPAAALLAAHLAGEGRRAVWIAAPGQAPDAQALARAGRLQLPLKLVCDAADLPAEPPPGWWIARPRDGGECAAALAWILNDESPWLLALPPAFPEVDAWPAGQAWEPPAG